jgi:protein-tyrosine-phosphatase
MREVRGSDGLDPMSSAIEGIIERLASKYHGVFSRETCAKTVYDSWDRLVAQATLIPPFMPALVERFAKDQLRAAAQVEGLVPKNVPEVLFVCVHNAGRSQMAAALAHRLGEGRIQVRSAGSQPTDQIYNGVTRVMAEIGLDVSHEFPKPLTDIVVEAADVVITMGCGDACPIFPGKRYEDWDVPNPAGQPIDIVREIRKEIEVHVKELLASLPTETHSPAGSVT